MNIKTLNNKFNELSSDIQINCIINFNDFRDLENEKNYDRFDICGVKKLIMRGIYGWVLVGVSGNYSTSNVLVSNFVNTGYIIFTKLNCLIHPDPYYTSDKFVYHDPDYNYDLNGLFNNSEHTPEFLDFYNKIKMHKALS